MTYIMSGVNSVATNDPLVDQFSRPVRSKSLMFSLHFHRLSLHRVQTDELLNIFKSEYALVRVDMDNQGANDAHFQHSVQHLCGLVGTLVDVVANRGGLSSTALIIGRTVAATAVALSWRNAISTSTSTRACTGMGIGVGGCSSGVRGGVTTQGISAGCFGALTLVI